MYSQNGTTIATVNSRTFIPKRSSIPVSSHSRIAPHLLRTTNLALSICLFQTFHINGILQEIVFCGWLPPLSRALSRVHGALDSLLCPNSTPSQGFITLGHQLMAILAVITLYLCTGLCVSMYFKFSWVHMWSWNCGVIREPCV